MAKKATKSATKHVESENGDQISSEPEANGAGDKGVSKAEAIRHALATGHDLPEEGTEFIRKTFGLDVSRQHFSASKSQIKSKEAEKQTAPPKGRPGRKPSQAIEGYLAPPPKIVPTGEGDLIDAMEAMKPLVASLGAEKVKRLADLLG